MKKLLNQLKLIHGQSQQKEVGKQFNLFQLRFQPFFLLIIKKKQEAVIKILYYLFVGISKSSNYNWYYYKKIIIKACELTITL